MNPTRRMRRRAFLKTGAMAAAGTMLRPFGAAAQGAQLGLMTVRGPIAGNAAGLILPHEHVMSTFRATEDQVKTYNRDAAFKAILPRLKQAKKLGLGTLADCTAAYFGRDPVLLRRLSKAADVHILTNTGYYGAADDLYVPEHAYSDTVDALAMRWVKEARVGIDGTGIRPGFIKIGVDGSGLSDIDAKLVRAAARAHLQTGLTIAVHTGDNVDAARAEIAILKEEGVGADAWIWVHAHKVKDPADIIAAAKDGAWIELDDIRDSTIDRHLELAKAMKRARRLDRVLLSHDGNTYRVSGGDPKPYEALFTTFIPLLRKEGFSKKDVERMTHRNPARALVVRVRRA